MPTFARLPVSAIVLISLAGMPAPALIDSPAPLTIDLTRNAPTAQPVDLGQGANKDPQGHALTADSFSFLLDGKPWLPIAGEFHYSRYPRAEWRDELLKMKAGGINTVSTYVFWIHQEEVQGTFDWSDRKSLRDFLKLCQEVGLKAIVRLGPWCHGEVRNGGLPDWVQNSGAKLRSTDPKFLDQVAPFYKEIAAQMQGLLWKDGGPVIAVQVDNECNGLPYLFALKKMAQDAGIDVPFYTMTGWNHVAIPDGQLLPLFGAYSTGFWGTKLESYRAYFMFSDIRDSGDMGAQMTNTNPGRAAKVNSFPFACAEIGGGMMSSYGHRIQVVPDDIAAMALARIGSGSNMPGYYMYQGGINPDGKLSYLNEDHPNAMPVKDYDFEAPLGACGEVRDQFQLLRLQHYFLADFGPSLARMPALFPDAPPTDIHDSATLRWDVRSDGKSGYLFFSDRQPTELLPDHPAVQFSVKTQSGTLLVPRQPLAIPSGSYGIWPLNLNCDGVTLEYATVQPLLRLQNQNAVWYFFTALDGIAPEMSFVKGSLKATIDAATKDETSDHLYLSQIKPGLTRTIGFTAPDGSSVNVVVLAPDQAKQLYRVTTGGRETLILSKAVVMDDPAGLRLQTFDPHNVVFSALPPLEGAQIDGVPLTGTMDGICTSYTPTLPAGGAPLAVSANLTTPAGPQAASLQGTKEETWNDAEVWQLTIPAEAANRRILLHLHYTGDAARLYAGDQFLDDNYYHGDPLNIGLWRIPADQFGSLRLKVLPYSDALLSRLPATVQTEIIQAKTSPDFGKLIVTADELIDLKITLPKHAAGK